MPYEIHQSNHDLYNIVTDRAARRTLGALAISGSRPFVWPLYTPAGISVLDNGPPDHPFHTGFFVAQFPVDPGGANFWVTPCHECLPGMSDRYLPLVGRQVTERPFEAEATDDGARFVLRVRWLDKQDRPVLDETRLLTLYHTADATVCDMVSRKTAAHGTVSFGKTKHGSIGIRVDPRLFPVMGGVVLADGNRRGNADEVAHGKTCRWVAYQNAISSDRSAGVVMIPLSHPSPGPWFCRDYGLAFLNATMEQAIELPAGKTWEIGMRVVAYDGELTDRRVGAWKTLASRHAAR